MIFRLECTIGQLADTSDAECETIFSALVSADREGRHFFVSSRAVCDWALENLTLSSFVASHLRMIREEFAVRRNLQRIALVHVTVRLGDAPVTFDGNAAFSIGHKALLRGQYLSSQAAFVVEDLMTDARLYSHMLSEARRVSSVPSFSFETVHGGGARTREVFDAEIEKRKVVVCVVDRDSSHPMGSKSALANAVMRIQRRRNSRDGGGGVAFIGMGCLTVGRELENYIPYHLYKIMYQNRNYPHFDRLDNVVSQDWSSSNGNLLWEYFDVKDGLRGEHLLELLEVGSISREGVEWICSRLGCDAVAIGGEEIKGFGERIVEAFFGSNESLARFHQFVRSKYWRCMYGEFFDLLLWYFAAPQLVRT